MTDSGSSTSDGDETDAPETGSSTDADSEGTGGDMSEWSFEPIYANPNLDDDNDEGRADWIEPRFDGDDELQLLELPAVETAGRVQLSLSGDTDIVRLWHESAGNMPLLDSSAGDPILEATLPGTGEASELIIEFGAYNARALLTSERRDERDELITSAEVVLRSSPVILNHHLLQAERVWVMDLRNCGAPNGPFLDGYAAALGDRLTLLNGPAYACDRWLQDEIEFATSLDRAGARLDTTIDSIRDRGLDDVPEDHFFGPGDAIGTEHLLGGS